MRALGGCLNYEGRHLYAYRGRILSFGRRATVTLRTRVIRPAGEMRARASRSSNRPRDLDRPRAERTFAIARSSELIPLVFRTSD